MGTLSSRKLYLYNQRSGKTWIEWPPSPFNWENRDPKKQRLSPRARKCSQNLKVKSAFQGESQPSALQVLQQLVYFKPVCPQLTENHAFHAGKNRCMGTHTHNEKSGIKLFPPVLHSVLLLRHTPHDPLKEQHKQCYSVTAVSQHLCALPEVGLSTLQVGQKDSPCRRSHCDKNNPNCLLGPPGPWIRTYRFTLLIASGGRHCDGF